MRNEVKIFVDLGARAPSGLGGAPPLRDARELFKDYVNNIEKLRSIENK